MKYRKLRIAWSVAWGVVAVLLCVLWVRSYWQSDSIISAAGPAARGVRATIFNGHIELDSATYYAGPPRIEWRLDESSELAPVFFSKTRKGFAWDRQYSVVPIWLPLIVAGAFAITPYIRWSNRFSLRALLIATTLVAVVLGLIVWAAKS
jgi:hypothetical protein